MEASDGEEEKSQESFEEKEVVERQLVRKPAEIRRDGRSAREVAISTAAPMKEAAVSPAAHRGKAWGSICPDPSSTLALSVELRL